MRVFARFFLILLGVTLTLQLQAAPMEEALQRAATNLSTKINGHTAGERFLISIINKHTNSRDTTASELETEMYFALEQSFPNLKRLLLSETLAGVSSEGTLFVKGEYSRQGNQITLQLRVMEGTQSGELIAQTKVSFIFQKEREKTLVAVLDVEAEILDSDSRKIYSEIFHSALNQLDAFEIASSAEVDKMDPDGIQEATGCTRDECATIIGEQLGVDRVISTSLIKRGKNSFFLTGKLFDINTGALIRSVNITHRGTMNDMDPAFEELAQKLASNAVLVKKVRKTKPGEELLALFPLSSSSKIMDETAALTDRMAEEILKIDRFPLVEQNILEEALERQGILAAGCEKLGCALKISKQLQATKAVIGSVRRIAGRYWLVKLSLIDIPNQKTIRTESIRHQGSYFELLDEGMIELVGKLFEESAFNSLKASMTRLLKQVQEEPSTPQPVAPEPEPVRVVQQANNKGKIMAFSIGVPTSFELTADEKGQRRIEVKIKSGNAKDYSYKIETNGPPTGLTLHWATRKAPGWRFGIGGTYVSQPVIDQAKFEFELQHTGIDFDWTYLQPNSLSYGLGFGLYSTNIECEDCTFNSGMGVALSLIKIGYHGDNLGVRFAHQFISGSAKRTYKQRFSRMVEEEHTWGASMLTASLTFMF